MKHCVNNENSSKIRTIHEHAGMLRMVSIGNALRTACRFYLYREVNRNPRSIAPVLKWHNRFVSLVLFISHPVYEFFRPPKHCTHMHIERVQTPHFCFQLDFYCLVLFLSLNLSVHFIAEL